MKKQILYILIAAALCGCTKHVQNGTIPPLAVEVMPVEAQETVYTNHYVARVEEGSSVPLSLPVGGKVTEVLCRVGDRVKAHQALLRVDDNQARQSYQAAEASLHAAQDGYDRAKQVYAEGGITEQKMVEIESKLTQAQSMAASAKKMLDDCTLYAPSGGTIGRCEARVGQTIAPAVTVVTILDVQALKMVFSVPEREIANIHIGDRAIASVPAAQQEDIPVVIAEKSLIANRVAHTYEVKALVQKTGSLLPGMAGVVEVSAVGDQPSAGVNQAVVLIPYDCVSLLQDGPTVWIACDSIAERRKITTGATTPDGVVVTSGLKQGELIITAGFHKLYNGAKISY